MQQVARLIMLFASLYLWKWLLGTVGAMALDGRAVATLDRIVSMLVYRLIILVARL